MNGTIRRKRYKTYYLNGKWMVEVQCLDCLSEYTLSEDEINCGTSQYRNNAMFGWTCECCNTYHVLMDSIIPEHIKDKVFYKKHSQMGPVIINFNDYKKRKGKN